MLLNMDKWLKDILPDKDPYHNRGRDQMRKKGGPEFECLWFFSGKEQFCLLWRAVIKTRGDFQSIQLKK